MAKPRLRTDGPDKTAVQNVLAYTLEATLRLLHPIIPFITEEIWQALPQTSGTICLSAYPISDAARSDANALAAINTTIDAIRALRNVRAELNIPQGTRLQAVAIPSDEAAKIALTESAALIAELAKLTGPLEIHPATPSAGKWVGSPITGAEMLLEIGDALDTGKERERIDKELAAIAKQIERAEGMLNNASFVERASAEKVEEERKRLADWQEKQSKLQERRRLFADA